MGSARFPKGATAKIGKPHNPAELEQEDKNVTVILFCMFALVTFFIVGMLTSVYVIIAGLVSAMLRYEWYFLYLPRRKKRQRQSCSMRSTA